MDFLNVKKDDVIEIDIKNRTKHKKGIYKLKPNYKTFKVAFKLFLDQSVQGHACYKHLKVALSHNH